MNDIKKKSIILSVIVLLMGLMIAGGTYAFLSVGANITNTNYVGISTCFMVDYNIDNGDNTENITGTLFPSLGPSEGLYGRVGLKVKDECEVNGIGTLKIHINVSSASLIEKATSHCEDKKTGDILTSYVNQASCSSAGGRWREYPASYCEDIKTLQTLPDYTTSGSCTANNGTWVTNGSPLKYAIYNTSNANGTPVKVGHITSSTGDITIYDNIILTHDQRYFYVYIWLDGYLTDNSHSNLSFDGYISASATQNDRLLPSTYEQVEWLGATGTQYINSGVSPAMYNGNYTVELEELHTVTSGRYIVATSAGTDANSSRGNIRINGDMCYGFVNNTSGTALSISTSSGTLSLNSKNNISFNVDSSNKKVYLTANGSTASISGNFISQSTSNFKIFGGAGTNFSGNIYYVKIYGNSDLVRHFIPCYRKSDSVRGMYDIIEGKFYTNAGSGTFEIPT